MNVFPPEANHNNLLLMKENRSMKLGEEQDVIPVVRQIRELDPEILFQITNQLVQLYLMEHLKYCIHSVNGVVVYKEGS